MNAAERLRRLRIVRDHVEVAYLNADLIPTAEHLAVALAELVADVDFLLAIADVEARP